MARSRMEGDFGRQNQNNEVYGLNFGPGCVNPNADCRLSLCDGVYAIVCMLVHGVGKVERGAGFCLQNMKLSFASSALARAAQI